MSILIWAFLSLSVSVGFEVLEHDADDARGQCEAQQGTPCAGSLGGSLLGTDGIHFLQGVAALFLETTGAWQVALVGDPEAWHDTKKTSSIGTCLRVKTCEAHIIGIGVRKMCRTPLNYRLKTMVS